MFLVGEAAKRNEKVYFTLTLDCWVIIPQNQKLYQQKKWVSQWAHWKNSGDTCPSLSRDSTAVRNKVVRSTWPQSVTAPVKLWSSTSAAWRMCVLIPVGLFREWKTTTLSRSWSVRVGIMRENGDGMKVVWKWNCTYMLHMSQATITVEYYTDIGTAMTCSMTTYVSPGDSWKISVR